MSMTSGVNGRTPDANTAAASRRSMARRSASSHARPDRTLTGQTGACAACSTASRTALSSPPENKTSDAGTVSLRYSERMYLVTKRIDFCYGHRLLDYDGICKHPHGHNAVVEVDVRTDRLDARNMVADFSDIKRIVKGWIDRELDHKMILRHDDRWSARFEAWVSPSTKVEATRPSNASPSSSTTTSREQAGLLRCAGDADVVR
jgi:6-pyruvoyl tetrahydropterin synthase/QueD family protein